MIIQEEISESNPLFVTGGSGFVGKYVVAWLLERGFFIRALVRSPYRAPFSFHKNLELVQGDLNDRESLDRAIESTAAVVHLAANKYDPRKAYEVNVRGAQNLARACERFAVSRFVNVSTQSAKIAQKGVYGDTKKQAEDVFRQARLQLTTLRPSLVYGPDEQSLFGFIAQQVMNLPIVPVLGSGQWRLRPVHVDDVAAAILACLENDETIGKTYDIGGVDDVSLNELIALIGEVTGKKPKILHVPLKVSLALAHVAAAVLSNPPIRPDNVLGSNQETHLDIRPMIDELSVQPISLREGVRLSLLGKRFLPHTLKVGIVGIGKTGLLHAAILNHIPEAQIIGIADANASLGSTARSMGLRVPFYSSFEQLLDANAPDAIFICTPTFAHYEQIKTCIARGINVFVEKPVTESFQRSEELAHLALRSGIQTGVGYFFRHRRTFRKAKELLEAGVLGTIRSFSASCYHGEVFAPKRGWLFDPKRSGGGVLINPASHLFDLLSWYFGPPTSVRATIEQLYSREVEDAATVTFQYENGFKGEMKASWSVPGLPILQNTIEVRGDNGTMTIAHQYLKLELCDASTDWPAGLSMIHESHWPETEVFNLNPQAGGGAYYLQDRAFVNACLKKSQGYVVSLPEAVESERIIHSAYNASREPIVEVRGQVMEARVA